MNLSELKQKPIDELLEMTASAGLDNLARSRKQDIIFALLKKHAKSGEDIYGKSCIACHGSGAAGAPKLGDIAGWVPRIGQGIDTLYTHAIKGFNGMPAKGLCMDCSDDEIKVAVDYMVSKSQ